MTDARDTADAALCHRPHDTVRAGAYTGRLACAR